MRDSKAPEWTIEAIPVLTDNYVWLLSDGRHALVVDPGEADPVIARLRAHDLELTVILLTHHHHDHIGGVAGLHQCWPEAQCIGPADPRIAGLTRTVADGERVELECPEIIFDVLAIPGHTLSHIAFFGSNLLFCGDTLFNAGCGRLFEGTPEQMLASLDRLAALPAHTRMYCGHEYTAANCVFAARVEPDNHARQRYQAEVAALRSCNQPTLPSTLSQQRAINPFLRSDTTAVRDRLQRERGLASTASRVEAFAALRSWKDEFRA